MSLLNIYRQNVTRKRNEVAKLQKDKAREQKAVSNLVSKINSASNAASKTKSISTFRSKQKEIERHNKSLATHQKKIATIDNKIAKKHDELFKEQKKVEQEEQKALKKRTTAIAENTSNTTMLAESLEKHEGIIEETRLSVMQLQQLPKAIKVLFFAANPLDADHLRLDEEARAIQEMIRKAKHRDSVQFETRWAVRPVDLLQSINETEPSIIHFSGHGTDSDEIVFQDDQGNAKFVTLEAILQMVKATTDKVRLVYFNTCFSQAQADAVTQFVEVAIGMSESISDDAARIFSSQFYSTVSFGHSVAVAFEQAKALLMMEGVPEEETPQLYVREGLSPGDIVIVRPTDDESL